MKSTTNDRESASTPWQFEVWVFYFTRVIVVPPLTATSHYRVLVTQVSAFSKIT